MDRRAAASTRGLGEIDACLGRMRDGRPFTLTEIELAARQAGVPNRTEDHKCPANRLADRLIQRERKAGNISLNGKGWAWKKPAVS